jgi:hypothetical protein
MSTEAGLATDAKDFLPKKGNAGIISSFSAVGLDLVTLCEDINDSASKAQVKTDAYKFVVDMFDLANEVKKSDSFLGEILNKAFAALSIFGDLEDIQAKRVTGQFEVQAGCSTDCHEVYGNSI